MTCAEVRARLDLYQDRVTDDTDSALIESHIAACEECRGLLANRAALRARLKSFVRSAEVSPDLGHRVQSAIAEAGSPKRVLMPVFGKPLMAIAAALIIAAGAFYFRPEDGASSKETQQQFIVRLSGQVAPVMRVGLRQHMQCGVFREYPAVAPALAELARDKQVSAALIDAVESRAPQGLHVVMAHRCSNPDGREYIHVVAKGQGHLMSLLITKRAQGETVAADATATVQSGPNVYALDAFETSEYLVYLVSDEPPSENLKSLRGMEAQVRAALL